MLAQHQKYPADAEKRAADLGDIAIG